MSTIFEKEFQHNSQMKKVSISMKIKYHEVQRKQDHKKIRELQRQLWEITGEVDKGIDLDALKQVNEKFKKMDLVPAHYNYPELYYL